MKHAASAVAQDYLKLIWTAREWTPEEPVTTTMLAARLGVTPPTASEAVKRLASRGLVRHAPYTAVELTPDGDRLAVAMVRRHRLLETFLVETLGYAWDEAHADAEVLEHAASDRFVDALDTLLGHPARDPHGDPIPAADGSVTHPPAAPLTSADQGALVQVERISDADPAMLRYFGSVGLVPGAAVTVAERRDYAGVLVLAVAASEQRVELGENAAGAIWVCPVPCQDPHPADP
ncbi:MAG: metal-dependent transcriptional regulator [Bifidobacteriaceae bacterium]|jgi:DtxR family Mn-dependent transcriptional regulator|nr:metal-dependent transcriptional regulator [Bifidobacteriaceae bacterium]